MPCDKKNKPKIEESSPVDKILSNSTVKNALEKIVRLSKSLNPENQKDLAMRIVEPVANKKATNLKIKNTVRTDFGKTQEAAKPEKGEDQKEKEVPIETLKKRLLGSQQFKQFVAKLRTMSSSAERAKAVQGLLDAIPKQDDQYKQIQKNYFER